MIYKWSKRFVKLLHFVRIGFKRLFIIAVVLIVGTALLSAYTLINMVNYIADVYKDSPGLVLLIIISLIGIPLIAYILEKGLNSYLLNKSKKISSSN